MADNYLENQYEQYQARKAAWERERKYGKKKKSVHPVLFRSTTKRKLCPIRKTTTAPPTSIQTTTI